MLISYILIPSSIHAITLDISNPVITGSEIKLEVLISDLTTPNYLQGTIRRVGASKYFGYTKNHLDEWFKYISSPDPLYIQSNFYYFEPVDGSWSGQITLRNDPESPNYQGSGEYEIKLRRYTGNSSNSASDSNTLIVNLIDETPTPSPTPTPTPKPTKTPRPSLIPISSISDDNLPLIKEKESTAQPQTFEADNIPAPSGEEILGISDDKDIDLSDYKNLPTSPSPSPASSVKTPAKNIGILSIISGGLFLIAAVVYYLNNKPS